MAQKPQFCMEGGRPKGCASSWPHYFARFILALFLTLAARGHAADPVGDFLLQTAVDAGATNEQAADAKRQRADLIAGQSQLAGLGKSITEAKNLFGDPMVGARPSISGQDILLIALVVVGGILAVRKLLPGILGSFNTWNLSIKEPVPAWATAAEADSFSDFVVEFRVGPKAPLHPPEPSTNRPLSTPKPAESIPEALPPRSVPELQEPVASFPPASTHREIEPPADTVDAAACAPAEAAAPKPEPGTEKGPDNPPLAPAESPAQFFATVGEDLARIRKFVAHGNGLQIDVAASQKDLRELLQAIHALKVKAGLPELLPVWQVCTALEGLLNQLIEKPVNISVSTLQTVAGAVDMLEALSVPGIKADLVSEPPPRILGVDDDAICRHAVSFALKKALHAPELASNGEAGLVAAEKQTYDVILLDVEMPGMDGFELCSRIRKTETNRDTPVVFVTRHSDFEARSKSALAGGNDLIGKPFLIFEITVKALTLLVRGRLKSQPVQPAPPEPAIA